MTVLHRALDGDGPQPLAFWVGRLCEEFHCLPSAAYREWLGSPAGFLEEIIEARHYAEAKRLYDSATTAAARKGLPRSALIDLVEQITFELAHPEVDG